MFKFSTVFLFSLMAGTALGQSRMATQAPVAQVSRSSSGQSSSDHVSTSSSYSGAVSQASGYSDRATSNSSSDYIPVNASNTSYHSGRHDHYGRVLYANNSNVFPGRGEFLPSQRLELPRQEIGILVFNTQPLEVGEKASNSEFRHSGLGFLAATYPNTQTDDSPLSGNGNPQQPNFNPFFQSSPKLQNCDYNKEQFSYTCTLTGLNTGYLSNHRCNGCVGYYHYWRTYTNFGCFEYLNGQINKVQSVEELKTLIQSYYDCIDYYQQYNFLDPNTRGRFRYGVGH